MKINSNIKRFVIIISAVLLFVFLLVYGGFLNVGSYNYAQEYKFEIPVADLYDRIEKFKEENIDYQIPTSINLVDSFDRRGLSHIYLIYKEKNTLIHIFVQGNKISSVYFDALNNLSQEFKWNNINQDFDRRANLDAKKEFRERILDKLKMPYKDNGNNAFVFWK